MQTTLPQNIPAPSGFVQDGADFYDATSHQLIASYPALVANDYDTNGAALARSVFLSAFPAYVEVSA